MTTLDEHETQKMLDNLKDSKPIGPNTMAFYNKSLDVSRLMSSISAVTGNMMA